MVLDPRVKATSRIILSPEHVKLAWIGEGMFGAWNAGENLTQALQCEYDVGPAPKDWPPPP